MDECEFYEFDGICSKCLPHELLCSQINSCTFKQLLAEQAKNKKLVEALESIKTKYEPYIAYLQVVEDVTKALNEVNK